MADEPPTTSSNPNGVPYQGRGEARPRLLQSRRRHRVRRLRLKPSSQASHPHRCVARMMFRHPKRGGHKAHSHFSAKGAIHTSLGQRPRTSRPTQKTGRGLKARAMLVQPCLWGDLEYLVLVFEIRSHEQIHIGRGACIAGVNNGEAADNQLLASSSLSFRQSATRSSSVGAREVNSPSWGGSSSISMRQPPHELQSDGPLAQLSISGGRGIIGEE
jgi:hypothetical protein